jgi:hypothetical protein
LKAGKKYFSDLMFTNEHESFIQWIEKLENYSQKYIYEHRELWFDTELDLHDIENSFSSCFKLYKSGKYYIVRTHVPTQMGKCSLKIYNDNEELVEPEEITDKNDIITILEIQGIKCSARSFQIEIEIKQMLVLPDNNLFEKCILVNGRHKSESKDATEYLGKPQTTIVVNTSDISNINNDIHNEQAINHYTNNDTEPQVTETVENNYSIIESNEDVTVEQTSQNEDDSNILISPIPDDELKEVELSLDEISESEKIQIKNRNDIYYKMYQDAKKKAKLAKDLALSAYLEAKHIKNTYMLEDLDDSDSDLDEDTFYEKP